MRKLISDIAKTRSFLKQENIVKSYASAMLDQIIGKRRILYYPHRPKRWLVEFRLAVQLGLRMEVLKSPRSEGEGIRFRHVDNTWFKDPDFEPYAHLYINGKCSDISKNNVDCKFEKVFGYKLNVNPLKYKGYMICKPNENGKGNPIKMKGPISENDFNNSYVYQRLIRTNDLDVSVEYRVPYHGGVIPFVYERSRRRIEKFKHVDKAVVKETGEVFSELEIHKMKLLCQSLYLDYGEMDVMRGGDGLLYVFDVNATPSGPQKGFTPEEQCVVVQRLARSFNDMLLAWKSYP